MSNQTDKDKLFKIQAVEKALERTDGVTAKDITNELGVGHSTLGKWIALARKQKPEPIQNNDGSRMIVDKRPQD